MAESLSIENLEQKSPDPKLIRAVFEFAKEAYKDKLRLSGENYIHHALRVADFLSNMKLDATTIAVALLHDAIDDLPQSAQKIELQEIEKKFGNEVSHLVEKVSRLRRIRYSLAFNITEKKAFTNEKIENLRRMFVALAGDLRAILVELASRMDSLDYLQLLPEERQKIYAIETLEIFVPVAHRLGLGTIRRKMEDLSFYYLFPEKYKWVQANIKERYGQREKHLTKFVADIKKILAKEGVVFSNISWRAKSHWSTYQKLARHNMNFDEIYDLLALRVIVKDVESCYKTLGIIHKHYRPISEEIKDYIARPKSNGYRSLHTTIFYGTDKISEIQIRTEEMHKEAEFGVCAHWAYKEKINLAKDRNDMDWPAQPPDFWKAFKIDFYKNYVFALTPRGDVTVLRKGSTPVDFAYAIHSDIGNHCESAKVNSKIMPLSYALENGDVVEIITNKKKNPSQDWLRFVKTSMAASHIKKAAGPDQSRFRFPLPGFIKRKIAEISEKAEKTKEQREQIRKTGPAQIYLAGQKGMLVHIAKCCNPQPGDKTKAYLTKHRSAVLHKTSCFNFKRLARKFPEKIIDAKWG